MAGTVFSPRGIGQGFILPRAVSTIKFNFSQCLHKLLESTEVLFDNPIRFREMAKNVCSQRPKIKKLRLKIDRNELSKSTSVKS